MSSLFCSAPPTSILEDRATQTDANLSDLFVQQAPVKEIAVSNVPPVNTAPNSSHTVIVDEKEERELKEQPYREKKSDGGYISYRARCSPPGSTTIKVYHLYDKSRPAIDFPISFKDLQFQPLPGYLGGKDGEPFFVYLNCQDPEYYLQQLEKPRLTVWIIIKNIVFKEGGYVKRRLVESGIKHNIQIRLLSPNKFDLALSSSGSESCVYAGERLPLPHAVIPRVGANVDYFGLAVLRQLEQQRVLVFNPPQSIEIARDKLYTHQVLASAGIPIPKSLLSRLPFEYEYIERHFGYPVIAKMASGSKGEAVWKIDNREELESLIKKIDVSKPIIFQDFLAPSKGRDLRCFVVGGRLVAAMMRIASAGFKANVHQGGSVRKVYPQKPLEELAVKVAKLCSLDFTGVDVLMDKDSYRICEVNSSPGFEGLERATEVNVADSILKHIEKVIEQQRKEGKMEKVPSMNNLVKEIPLQEEDENESKTHSFIVTAAPQSS